MEERATTSLETDNIETQRARLMDREPENNEAIAICARAYRDLSTCCSIGMERGPIPWTAMVAWTAHHDLDRDASRIVLDVIRFIEGLRAEKEASKRALENLGRK